MKALLILALALPITAQNPAPAKPCITFSANAPLSEIDRAAKDALRTAVTLSGDYRFSDNTMHDCWIVDVISMPIAKNSGNPGNLGYALNDVSSRPALLHPASPFP